MNRQALGWTAVAVQFLLLAVLVLLPRRSVELWPPAWPVLVGVALAGLAGVFGLVALVQLSTALTPTPVPLPDQSLRTGGVYRVVRHPIYTAVLGVALGFTIAIGSWWTAACWLVLVAFFVVKSRWEDRMLAERFGEQWIAYAAATPALVSRPTRVRR